MEIIILERLQNSPLEVKSRVKAKNVVLNVTSQFVGSSSLDELLFNLSEQKIMNIAHREIATGRIAI